MAILTRYLIDIKKFWILIALLGSSCFGQALFFSSNVPHGPLFTGKHCSAFSGFPITCTWSAAPSVGETIHCVAQGHGGTVTAYAITDNAGTPNTYAANGAVVGPATTFAWYMQLLDTFNVANSPTTTTLSVTGTAVFSGLQCITTTGTAGAAIDGTRGTATTIGTSNSVTIAPVIANDFGICGSQADGAATYGAGTAGWVAVPSDMNIIYKNLLSAGSQATVATTSVSLTIVTVCGTYK